MDHVFFDELRRVAFISPHPDDVELCCGILVKRLVQAGTEVHYICVTDGAPSAEIAAAIGSLPGDYDQAAYKLTRRRESLEALNILGVERSRVKFLDYPDLGTLDHIRPLVVDFSATLESVDAVFCCPFEGGHPDHDICRFALAVAGNQTAYAGNVFEYASYNSRGYQEFLSDFPTPFTLRAEPSEEEVQRRVARVFASQKQMASQFKTGEERFRRAEGVFHADQFLFYNETPEYEQFAFPGSRVLDKIREYLLFAS